MATQKDRAKYPMLSVTVPAHLIAKLSELAEATGETKSGIVAILIDNAVPESIQRWRTPVTAAPTARKARALRVAEAPPAEPVELAPLAGEPAEPKPVACPKCGAIAATELPRPLDNGATHRCSLDLGGCGEWFRAKRRA